MINVYFIARPTENPGHYIANHHRFKMGTGQLLPPMEVFLSQNQALYTMSHFNDRLIIADSDFLPSVTGINRGVASVRPRKELPEGIPLRIGQNFYHESGKYTLTFAGILPEELVLVRSNNKYYLTKPIKMSPLVYNDLINDKLTLSRFPHMTKLFGDTNLDSWSFS